MRLQALDATTVFDHGSQEVRSYHSSSERTPLVARPPTDRVYVSDDRVQMPEWVGASVSGRRLRAGLIRGQQTAPEIC